jgi:PAS domain-containing protein
MYSLGYLIVDPHRRIVFANPRARSFLDAKSGLEERSGKVHIERANIDRSLGELIQRAAGGTPPAVISEEAVGIPDRQGHTRYAVTVIRCRTDQGEAAALLVIADLLSAVHVISVVPR